VRLSRRYANYLRVYNIEYKKALIDVLREDAADLIEALGMKETIDNLERRICEPERMSVSCRLVKDILDEANVSSPFKLSGRDFNLAAEKFYRETLRKRHITEAIIIIKRYSAALDAEAQKENSFYREPLKSILKETKASDFLDSIEKDLLEEKITESVIGKLIQLTLLVVEKLKESNHIKE
jgi:hypothetical protein